MLRQLRVSQIRDEITMAMTDLGGEVVIEIEDRPPGKREGRVRDPFGNVWILSKTIETLTNEQIQNRLVGQLGLIDITVLTSCRETDQRYALSMNIHGFDHIVLCVHNVDVTLEFYQQVLGMTPREERPGKWSLHFGSNKISLQGVGTAPDLAKKTVPGSGNFCLLTDTPIEEITATLRAHDVTIVEGPSEKLGAVGRLMSVYFRDPDDNLVEVSNRLA